MRELTSKETLPLNESDEKSSSGNTGLNFNSYLRTFRRKALLIAGTAGLTTLAAFLISLLDGNTYLGVFRLLVEPVTSQGQLSDPSVLTRSGDPENDKIYGLDYPTQVEILKSRKMLSSIAEELKTRYRYNDDTVNAIVENLQQNLIVQRVGATRLSETKIIEVLYRSSDPNFVQAVLEITAKRYLKYSEQERETNINAGVKFIDEQVPKLQERVNNLRNQQQDLQKKYQLIDPTTRGQELFTQFHQLNDQQTQIENQLKELKASYINLQKQLRLTQKEALMASDLSQDPGRQVLLGKLQEIESQIATESTRFTSQSPNIQDLEEKRQNIIDLLNQKSKTLLGKDSAYLSQNQEVGNFQNSIRLQLIQQLVDNANQIQILEVRNQSLIDTRKKLAKKTEEFPQIARQYNELGRQLELTSRILDQLLMQKETLRVEAAQNYVPWELVSDPAMPKDAEGHYIGFPPARNKKIVAGLLGGMLLGMGGALLWEKRKNIFYSSDDIQDLSAPLLADIPEDDNHEENWQESNSLFTNAFETLYAKICFLYSDSPIRSLIVTSAEGQDGQSTVAFNLAKTAAEEGKKVLLVDANLRQPQLHGLLNLPNHKGLNNVLKGESSPQQVIQPSPDISNLFLLSAGVSKGKPTKLWSMKMQAIMESLSAEYDLIIYDPPHFLDSTDVSFMAAHTDGVIMVVGVAKTSQTAVKEALQQMKEYRLPLLGLVANNISYSNQEEGNLAFHQSYQSNQAVSNVS